MYFINVSVWRVYAKTIIFETSLSNIAGELNQFHFKKMQKPVGFLRLVNLLF